MFGIDIQTFMILIYTIIALVVFVMTVLIPFFVLRIRNESIKTNRLLDEIQAMAPGSAPKYKTSRPSPLPAKPDRR